MGATFPQTCKLTPSEREVLRSILSENESPCDDCTWTSECDGPELAEKAMAEFFKNPTNKCALCGEDAERTSVSRLINGVFRFCSTAGDEFVFNPLEAAPKEGLATAVDEITF